MKTSAWLVGVLVLLSGCDPIWTVSGKVTVADAGPEGIEVVVRCPERDWGDWDQKVAITRADGSFALGGVGEMSFACRVRAMNHEVPLACVKRRSALVCGENSCIAATADIDANSPVVK